MADSTVLTETEKSNHLITMRVMMTIMCISSPSSIMESSKNYTNAKNSCLFQYYMRTHLDPLPPHSFDISNFPAYYSSSVEMPDTQKKGADSGTKTDDLHQTRDKKEDFCVIVGVSMCLPMY